MGALNTERINLMPLNRSGLGAIIITLTDGYSSTGSIGSGVINGVFGITGVSETSTIGEGIITGIIYLKGESETATTAEGSFAIVNFLVNGVSDTLSEYAGHIGVYQDITIEFTGDIAAGETLIIDSDKYTALLDGTNAIDKIDGDFPIIAPGTTLIAYSDSESARSMKITVNHKNRWI